MSIRRSVRTQLHTPPTLASVYHQSFVREVHLLLAAGHARLAHASLAHHEETVITEKLVTEMRGVIEGPRCPRWAARFSIHEEAPLSGGSARGKARRRIDIEVERTLAGPRPRFQLEAKRLCRSDSVAEYLGADGLGCFIGGAYAATHLSAGMVGYVQTATPSSWATKVSKGLGRHRAKHRLPKNGNVWQPATFPGCITITFRSTHARETAPIDIFHTFLVCC